MIRYLVCGSEAAGVADGERRGWVRVARRRFATGERDDVRVVWRFGDMVPHPSGVTEFVCGDDLDRVAPEFGEFVASGRARWVDE